MSEATFGHIAAQAQSTAELLLLEEQEGRAEQFAPLDVAVAGLMIRATRGERVVQLDRTERGDSLAIVGVPRELKDSLAQAFQLEAQQSRGAWFLPDTVSIKARALLLAAFFREAPRYAHTLAADEKAKVALAGNPDAMVVWSVLEPFAEMLFAPIVLRVEESGLLDRAEFESRFAEARADLAALQISVADEVLPFRWGGGWSQFTAEQQVAAKGRLLDATARATEANTVRHYRALMVRRLVQHYYAKAKKGRAKRKQVITKDYARTLAGFFAGDWLGFLRYLGEEPHDEERVVTALPEARLLVSGKDRAIDAAAKRGIPAAEAELIVGALWKDTAGSSPVLERAAAAMDYWRQFDELHAQQRPGMHSLWGLVEDGPWATLGSEDTPYRAGLFRQLLPAELVARIDRFWSTTALEKWPDRIVSEPFPHSVMAEIFGPALKFWHGCALTAWFVCEGPRSRADIPGLAEYHRRELAALEDKGCPIPSRLFDDLRAVRLGPEEATYSNDDRIDVGHGMSINVRMTTGTRRSGFEKLRDVITRHRRAWSAQHLEGYIRMLWEAELKIVSTQFHRMTEEKGKHPTLKQFAKYAVPSARRWFGGDVSLLYSAIGQRMPGADPQRTLIMPADRIAFADRVFAGLGGLPFERKRVVASRAEGQQQAEEQGRTHQLRRLAMDSLAYVQLLEALGRPPTLKEFGSKFEWPGKAIGEDVIAAWDAYVAVIDRALAG